MVSKLATLHDHGRDADLRSTGNCTKPGVDPDIFFDEYARSLAEAQKICTGCPVRTECLELAVENGERGVWAGTSERDRRAIRVERRLNASRQVA